MAERSLRDLTRGGPLGAADDDFLDGRGHQGLAVVAVGVVNEPALAAVLGEDQWLGPLKESSGNLYRFLGREAGPSVGR